MKSFAIAAVLALVGFASMAAPAAADHFDGYRRGPASCAPQYGHGHDDGHNHGRVTRWRRPVIDLYQYRSYDHGRRYDNDGGLYFGNRDFSFGIRF